MSRAPVILAAASWQSRPGISTLLGGPTMTERVSMDTLASLCKRRGFVYPAAEIYGGFANAWDYGPLGVAMRRNIRDAWWRATVQERDDVVGIEATIITNPKVWE